MNARRKGVIAALVGAGLFSLACSVGGDIVAYDLPAEQARYTLENDADGVATVWEYTSQRPAEDGESELQPCMGTVLGDPDAGPCQPEPLIFLRYDLGVDLANTAPANRPHQITIAGYYQEGLESPPELTELRLEASFDGAQTWQPVATSSQGDGTFTATIRSPRLADTAGTVGLRVAAADTAGNTVEQTITEAFGLR